MAKEVSSLNDIIQFNKSFKTAINLYLSLNKTEKVLGYIPTKSSVNFMGTYLSAVLENKEQATLLVGPYGKGKSHLLLVLLAILSMERTSDNDEIVKTLINKIKKVDEIGESVADKIKKVWKKKRFLPVLITDTTGDLNQAFIVGLNEALKREGLQNLSPNTYYSIALERIEDWKKNYKNTYKLFEKELSQKSIKMPAFIADLKMCSREALSLFKIIYPKVTSGSEFNPIAVSDVLPLYKNIGEILVEEYDFSGIYIVFDEFSKFIESQDGTASGTNMRLLQDICELCTDSEHAQFFITMVAHKSIKEYGKYLTQDIINSFTGIEGRIIEKYFITSAKNNYELIKNAIIKDEKQLLENSYCKSYIDDTKLKEFYQLPAFRSNFLENEFKNVILKGCYPLNPIAAYLLLNISEKVAQNERTLFTFISNDEPHSMARFVSHHTQDMEWSIGVDLIYDYFCPLFKKDVSNEFVHNIWLSAEYSIDKCKTNDQKKLIKALAIILIVNKDDEIPATEKYLKLCINASDINQALNELVDNQFIYKKNSTETYVFRTKAGSELKKEIKRQRELKGDNVNYGKTLLEVTGKYYIIPREYNTKMAMTRYFVNEFMNVDDFLSLETTEVLFNDKTLDGKVISLYSFVGIKQEQVKAKVIELEEKRLVVVCPKKGLKAKEQLKEYEIISELRDNQTFTNNNQILKKELPLLVEDLTMELETIISSVYEEDADTRVYLFDGEKTKNVRSGNEEKAVNECCFRLYSSTPVINNEMVNRAVINTAQTKKSRINVINAILNGIDTPDFYEGSNQEATIYRSLFFVTNIVDGNPKPDIKVILDEIDKYIDSCSDKKVFLTVLINKLIKEPYGMRAGLIPFYLAYVIKNRKEDIDIIVYFVDKEIQLNAYIIINMCENPDDYALYVSKADLQKKKFITEMNMLFQVKENRNLTTNRIKDIFICMQRWFRALPLASRNATEINKYIKTKNTVRLMLELKQAMQLVEYNSFEILFVKFPLIFGNNTLEETYKKIDECKTYYDDYFKWIEEQAISAIYDIWDKKKKQDLFHTLKEWYEKQSKRSRQGLYDDKVTSFMSCIENFDVYSDTDVAGKVVKSVTGVYLENWNTGSLEEFSNSLKSVKTEIENIRDDKSIGEFNLTFTGRNGEIVNKLYSHANENTGSVLRNIIEDTLEEYSDLSINDRVSILLEMIEKIIK